MLTCHVNGHMSNGCGDAFCTSTQNRRNYLKRVSVSPCFDRYSYESTSRIRRTITQGFALIVVTLWV